MRALFFLATILVLGGILTSLVACPPPESLQARREGLEDSDLTTALLLTDLSIWTEARYTRHPSQSDLFTPFQDGPGTLEHFPSGTLGTPPLESWKWRSQHLSKPGEKERVR